MWDILNINQSLIVMVKFVLLKDLQITFKYYFNFKLVENESITICNITIEQLNAINFNNLAAPYINF